MDPLHLAHLVFLGLWGGILLCEFILECLGDDDHALRFTARAHFWIDVLAELPVLLGVLGTGAALLGRAWPPSAVLQLKVAAGLVAIGSNLYCAVLVALRYRRRGDPQALRAWRPRVRMTALGVPFGAVAAWLGLRYFAG
ncbi:MAG: hypothetical protein HY909_16145 [Deltaproteobacteria bacterium]|nr:hypothetical protein [Deltaproteobacteria bacterium]